MLRPCSLLLLVFVCVPCSLAWAEERISGDAAIRGRVGGSDLVIRTTNRLAGAIDSLRWDGVEFVNSTDHGRQIQSASNLDDAKPFFPEVFNPTEAGSRRDGAGPRSSSKLLKLEAKGNQLHTINQMAFWLAPGETSAGHPAYNTTILSNHLIEKRVKIGHKDLPHAIEYDVVFTLPDNEKHTYAQFEAVTGYMPAHFSMFWRFDPTTGRFEELSDGPGEQNLPVVLATPDGRHAMGVYSPDQPSPGYEAAGYGRFRFVNQRVVKWNCVFRIRDPRGLKPGRYAFRQFVVVGNLEQVRKTLIALEKESKKVLHSK